MHAYINNFLLAFVCVLYVLAVSLGFRKMVRVVIGNYIISFIVLAFYSLLQMLRYQMINNKLGFIASPDAVIGFLDKFDVTIAIVLYLLLFVSFVRWSKIHYVTNRLGTFLFVMGMVYAPFVVMSILMSVAVVIVGIDILDYQTVLALRNDLLHVPYLRWFLEYTPLWFIAPGLVTILLSVNVSIVRNIFMRNDREEVEFVETPGERVVMTIDE